MIYFVEDLLAADNLAEERLIADLHAEDMALVERALYAEVMMDAYDATRNA